ncbi:unnamed protein product [Kuraishia capsulata CBS 1993]|uniref:Mitochondrial resolvase Ydc2 catalytic domain-containing protein n=1 Tax=Kuraishia capsulata CBS 1993 TaxID=1382522 RepID=W6MKB9_9ASCO|nr:uncharacterized protein KUCA_T00001059001 [Kuraishia capsulata CBS 1993]CDK25092.1 unnamed protein product [Kuraishia capsulata CBS 1993]
MDKLLKLKNNELANIAKVCGMALAISATQKTELASAIAHNLTPGFVGDKQIDLVAIDVGLVNFSFARLTLPHGIYSTPILQQWYKMDLFAWSKVPRDFHPSSFAKLVNKVVFDLIYGSAAPDLVIVERQRFRTMGNKNVFEHILRTNVLESMLYSSLETLQRVNPKKYCTQLVPSSPQTMVHYWAPPKTQGPVTAKQSKEMRMKLVDHWLKLALVGSKSRFRLVDSAIFQPSQLLKAKSDSRRLYDFMEIFNENNKHKISVSESSAKAKGDDLADSLLYGLSWVDYERNKHELWDAIEAGNVSERLDEITSRHFEEISSILKPK